MEPPFPNVFPLVWYSCVSLKIHGNFIYWISDFYLLENFSWSHTLSNIVQIILNPSKFNSFAIPQNPFDRENLFVKLLLVNCEKLGEKVVLKQPTLEIYSTTSTTNWSIPLGRNIVWDISIHYTSLVSSTTSYFTGRSYI